MYTDIIISHAINVVVALHMHTNCTIICVHIYCHYM